MKGQCGLRSEFDVWSLHLQAVATVEADIYLRLADISERRAHPVLLEQDVVSPGKTEILDWSFSAASSSDAALRREWVAIDWTTERVFFMR